MIYYESINLLLFLDILAPSMDKSTHDHTYSMPPRDEETKVSAGADDKSEPNVPHYPLGTEFRVLSAESDMK